MQVSSITPSGHRQLLRPHAVINRTDFVHNALSRSIKLPVYRAYAILGPRRRRESVVFCISLRAQALLEGSIQAYF